MAGRNRIVQSHHLEGHNFVSFSIRVYLANLKSSVYPMHIRINFPFVPRHLVYFSKHGI